VAIAVENWIGLASSIALVRRIALEAPGDWPGHRGGPGERSGRPYRWYRRHMVFCCNPRCDISSSVSAEHRARWVS